MKFTVRIVSVQVEGSLGESQGVDNPPLAHVIYGPLGVGAPLGLFNRNNVAWRPQNTGKSLSGRGFVPDPAG